MHLDKKRQIKTKLQWHTAVLSLPNQNRWMLTLNSEDSSPIRNSSVWKDLSSQAEHSKSKIKLEVDPLVIHFRPTRSAHPTTATTATGKTVDRIRSRSRLQQVDKDEDPEPGDGHGQDRRDWRVGRRHDARERQADAERQRQTNVLLGPRLDREDRRLQPSGRIRSKIQWVPSEGAFDTVRFSGEECNERAVLELGLARVRGELTRLEVLLERRRLGNRLALV